MKKVVTNKYPIKGKKEIEVIKYLVKEAEERIHKISAFEKLGGFYLDRPPRSLITDNMKKIRQLALKISKEYQ